MENTMDSYEQGFITKCAEYGIDGEQLLYKMAKIFRRKPDFEMINRFMHKSTGSLPKSKLPNKALRGVRTTSDLNAVLALKELSARSPKNKLQKLLPAGELKGINTEEAIDALIRSSQNLSSNALARYSNPYSLEFLGGKLKPYLLANGLPVTPKVPISLTPKEITGVRLLESVGKVPKGTTDKLISNELKNLIDAPPHIGAKAFGKSIYPEAAVAGGGGTPPIGPKLLSSASGGSIDPTPIVAGGSKKGMSKGLKALLASLGIGGAGTAATVAAMSGGDKSGVTVDTPISLPTSTPTASKSLIETLSRLPWYSKAALGAAATVGGVSLLDLLAGNKRSKKDDSKNKKKNKKNEE